jgi:hypothetical protein
MGGRQVLVEYQPTLPVLEIVAGHEPEFAVRPDTDLRYGDEKRRACAQNATYGFACLFTQTRTVL